MFRNYLQIWKGYVLAGLLSIPVLLGAILYKIAVLTGLKGKQISREIPRRWQETDHEWLAYQLDQRTTLRHTPLRGITFPMVLWVITAFGSAGWMAGNIYALESKEAPLYLLPEASRYITDLEDFEVGIREIAADLDIPPEWLMGTIWFESKFDHRALNRKGSGATGLIQFMRPALDDINQQTGTHYRMSDLRSMTPLQQLELVRAYLTIIRSRYGPFNSPTDLYLAVLYPRALRKGCCAPLFAKPARSYYQNKGLDLNHDGKVYESEVEALLKRRMPSLYTFKK